MIYGKVLSKFYAKHTSGLKLDNLIEQVHQTYDNIPVIKERIGILQNLNVSKALQDTVEKELGKSIIKHIKEQPKPINQWALYNYITWYISHMVEQRMRAHYQISLSKIFNL